MTGQSFPFCLLPSALCLLLYNEIDAFVPLLKRPDSWEILETAYKLSGLKRGTATINTATDRASDIEAVGNATKYAKLYRYIAKPWQTEDLSLTVREAVNSYLQEKKLAEKNILCQLLNQELEQSLQLLSASDRKFRAIFNQTFQ